MSPSRLARVRTATNTLSRYIRAARHGTVRFGVHRYSAITPTDLDAPGTGLTLTVSALMGTVPIGAPVRINIILRNESEGPVVAPATLSIKTGIVSGAVIDPSDTVRTFWSLFLCVDETPLAPPRIRNALWLVQ
ncbi:MAG: hypothetical protein ACREYC_28645 [Gammaproteobacteria bacterium]